MYKITFELSSGDYFGEWELDRIPYFNEFIIGLVEGYYFIVNHIVTNIHTKRVAILGTLEEIPQ